MTDTKYPYTPGFTEHTTSKAAADKLVETGRHNTVKQRVVQLFRNGFEGSAEQVADKLNIPYVTVQPRISELYRLGIIEHSGRQVLSRWNRMIHDWRRAK